MRSPSRLLAIFVVVMSVGACKGESPQSAATPATPNEPASSPADTTAPASSPVAAEECTPYLALNKMDPRTPVPLQPMMAWHQKQNMQEHLVAIQRITDGLAKGDWEAVSKGSAMIESSPQMAQMCQHMGAGAEGFTELALDFHGRADKIGEAAKAKDVTAVLAATSNTLQACTTCHSAYRQDVVDAATWEKRTGSSHDPSKMQH